MGIHSGTPLFYVIFYWPFILGGITSWYFFARLSIGKLLLLFVTGVLVGYGVSMFFVLPITTYLIPLFSNNMSHEVMVKLLLAIQFLVSLLLTGAILWTLGKSLSKKA